MKKIIFLFITTIFIVQSYGQYYITDFSGYRQIEIIPIGDINNKVLYDVAKGIEDFYGYKCIISKKHIQLNNIKSITPDKYDADKILNEITSTTHYLVISSYDVIDLISGTYEYSIWGMANCPGRAAVVSTYNLKTDDETLFTNRVIKVCLHEIGHNIGLKHCTNNTYRCIMHEVIRGTKELDAQNAWFCEKCYSEFKK